MLLGPIAHPRNQQNKGLQRCEPFYFAVGERTRRSHFEEPFDFPIRGNLSLRIRATTLARDYRKPVEIQGTAIRITSARNNAVRCGQTRPIATSGDTRPIAHAA